jgi:hypothetical protein
VDTTLPTVSITFPAPNAALTNGSPLTITGTASNSVTASNNFGLAEVFCVLTSLTGAYGDESLTNAATGTTNWSLDLGTIEPGVYQLTAFAQDGAGHLSAPAKEYFTNWAALTIKLGEGGTIVGNPGPYVVPGTYTVKAVPKSGYAFYSWYDGVTTTLNPSKTFQLVSNLTLTATFVPEDHSLQGITFTYPRANAMLTNGAYIPVAGRLPASLVVTQMTCQLFLQSNGVTASPQAATISNFTNWYFPVTNLAPGSYKILAVAYDNKGNARLVSENFNLLAELQVIVQGTNQGTVTAGLNGKYIEVRNKAYTNYVEVGKAYPIKATPKKGQIFAYWTGPVVNVNSAATTLVMSSNTVLTATFTTNHFPAVAGTYTGLFLDPSNVSPTNAGFVTITTTGTGAFSGELKFPSRNYSIYYIFPYTGSVALLAKGFDSNLLQLVLNLDLTNDTDTVTGYVADETASGYYIWTNSLVLYRSVTRLNNAPAAGKYVVLLEPENDTNAPAAAGYAAISLQASGAVAMGGTLPDNTAISQSAKMSKDGIWPVYIVPSSYKRKGMIIGWQTNTPSGTCDGQLFWFKPAIGYATNLTSSGAAFEAPAEGTDYPMVRAGGITNWLAVSNARQFVPQSTTAGISFMPTGIQSNSIVRIFLLPTGVLSGTIDVDGKNRPFKGAFISPADGGAGFILDANGQTDGFQILPQP